MLPVSGGGMFCCGDGGISGPLFELLCADVLPEMLTESLSLRNIKCMTYD